MAEPQHGKSHLQIKNTEVGFLSEQDINIHELSLKFEGFPVRAFIAL